MKTLIPALLIILALPAFAGGDILEGLAVRPFIALETEDFDDDERLAGGAGLSLFVLDNIGTEVEGIAYDSSGPGIDRANANALFKANLAENAAVLPFGGVGRDFETDEWGFQLGLRLDWNIWKALHWSFDGRWVNDDGVDSRAAFTTGIAVHF